MADVIVTVALEAAKCLLGPIKRSLSYLCNYTSNLKNLKAELEKLKDENVAIQHRIDDAKRKGEEIEKNVENWLESVKKIMDEVGTFIQDDEKAKKQCIKGLCPNLKTRYQLSKKAMRQLEAVVKLQDNAGKLQKVSYYTIPEDIRLTTDKDFDVFESRVSILKDILNALTNPDFNMIGVYGMGGVGKTTLVKEVARQAKGDKLFNKVVFAEVSQNPDIRKIQGEIADTLGLVFHEESESGRAGTLYKQLNERKKILIILDNIWTTLDLKAIGIPTGDDGKGCKVLLTARSEDVLSRKMDSKKNFQIDILNDEEAWLLFKRMAGEYIEDSEFKSIAIDVVKECAGLPISIVTVAKALRNSSLAEWNDALLQLRRPSSMNFRDIQASAYSTIELSYNKLEGEELKKVFLLIGYTYITSINELLAYGMGLGLYQGIIKMEEAQARVRTLVRKLKASCMLFDSSTSDKDYFSMHDVVRDVAISIASGDQHVFTARNELENQWEFSSMENSPRRYNSIVLLDVMISELPEVLECPQLKLFSLDPDWVSSLKIPGPFFSRMTELRVLHLSKMHLPSLPSSLCVLTNLRTLSLYSCKLDDLVFIGNLRKLEFLCFSGCNLQRLPVEVGQLTRLRSLDLSDCFNLKVIPPNVISRLSQLEELYMEAFSNWEVEGPNNKRRNASLDELKHLPKLTCLQIRIEDAKTLPRDLSFKKLERYKILVGGLFWHWDKTSPEIIRRFKLELSSNNICLNEGHIMQLKGIQDLCLEGIVDMKNVLYGLDKEGFPQLKYLQVRENENLLCVVDSMDYVTCNAFPVLESLYLTELSTLEKICRGQVTTESFCKLRKIKVEKCRKLENILSFSIARRLQQLHSIKVTNCKNMQQIFVMGREDKSKEEVIELSQLRKLKLDSLPKLTSFCSQQRHEVLATETWSSEIGLADDINVPADALFNEKVRFPNLEVLKMYKINVQKIWQNQVAATSSGIQNLTSLILSNCSNLRCIFTSSLATSFVRLRNLEISKCPALKEIIVVHERKDVVFPQLNHLKMENLESLTNFCSYNHSIEFPSLKKLEIMKCPELSEFMEETDKDVSSTEIPSSLFNEKVAFPSLEQFVISKTNNLKMLWHHRLAKDSFCKLTSMNVESCHKLQIIFPQNIYRKFLLLESLSVTNCRSLEVIFDGEGPNFETTHHTETQLSKLYIVGLSKLKHVWNKDPQKFVSFQKLNEVTIDDCARLKNVFPTSVARSLSQLEKLYICKCGVEEIVFVSDQEGVEANLEFFFPRMISLILYDLPNFTSFFPAPQPLCKVFPNLKELFVGGKCVLTMIWQFPVDACKIETLIVELDESTAILSLDSLLRFQNVRKIQIDGGPCVNYSRIRKKMHGLELGSGFFSFLWSVFKLFTDRDRELESVISNLNKCPDLKYILKEESNMDHLVHLRVKRCTNLVNLVPSSTSFQNLTTLEVWKCKGLTKIITSSAVNSLVQLKAMSIWRCNMITEIVADVADAATDYEIIFRELKKLSLSHLESLTSFCSGNCNFNFPSLKELTVNKCPNLKIFSGGQLSTPMLHKVKQHRKDKVGCWEGNLNATIQQLHEEIEEDEEMSDATTDHELNDEEEDAEGSGITEEDEEESDTGIDNEVSNEEEDSEHNGIVEEDEEESNTGIDDEVNDEEGDAEGSGIVEEDEEESDTYTDDSVNHQVL